ncbi:MAG: phosphoribosylformylglycinamidine synthase subunit PurL [Candidatus Omnitrophica bacterium]|nr:phosphoribosylformylglycinamidine synthase subunit PurL [Candidatus Omnitrophota bacterium]
MITKDIYRALGLRDDEYERILKILGREPTKTELAMFSVEWSEHCGYPRSRKYLKLLPRKGRYEVLVGEDAGGIVVGDTAIIFKMESHNHPSQVEPKQGAATGVGGIIRDIFTSGARPVASLNSLRFGELTDPYTRYLLRGVVDGIQFYGNCIGVPTVGGEIYFDDAYQGNCLVNAMSLGIAKREDLARAVAQGTGNPIMYVGSKTGRDGIGGCSVLASAEFGEGDAKRPTVQIGDPFTEKCLIEATMEALKTGYIVGIKDMGAAGLTCSSSEMASAGGCGMEIDISKVPRREEGMEPWEVMMSESQERMLVCVKKGKEEEVAEIFKRWDLEGVVIGYATDDKKVRVLHEGEVVAEMPTACLTDPPLYDMPYEEPAYIKEVRRFKPSNIKEPSDYNKVLLDLLASPTITNKAWVYEQYDHMVQVNTAVYPGSDAAVLRLKGSKRGIAVTTDCNGLYCYLNPRVGARIAVAEAARNLVCTGAHPAGATDCLNFGNPEKPDRFWQFKNCVESLAEACEYLNIPVVSGNVSFYNESPNGPIFPTPTIGMIGIIEDIDKRCTANFKDDGDLLFLLGECKDELGGSEYLKRIHGVKAGDAPECDLEIEKRLQEACLELIDKGAIKSAHDCSEGGLVVAIAESCISSEGEEKGAAISVPEIGFRKDSYLFGETQSRIVISCSPRERERVKKIASSHKIIASEFGKVGGDSLTFEISDKKVINIALKDLIKAWRGGLKKYVS